MRQVFIPTLRMAQQGLLLALVLGLQGCGAREATSDPAQAAQANPPGETTPESNPPRPVPTGAPLPSAQARAPLMGKSVASAPPMPGVALVRAIPDSAASPKSTPQFMQGSPGWAVTGISQANNPMVDPGGEVAVKLNKPGLLRVGVGACRMCHKLQFTSWSATAHARRTPPLDCESCHGPGSEYKAMPVMKDPAKARAAGLILPDAPFCATCHHRNWSAGLLQQAHAHTP